VIIPILVKVENNLPAWYLGLLESAVSIGVIGSALLISRLNQHWNKEQLLPPSFIIMSGACIFLSFSSAFIAVVTFGLLGIGVGLANMLLSELIAHAVSDEFRCRFASITVTIQGCARVLALMLGGIGIDNQGSYTILLWMGIALLLFSAVMWLHLA